MSGWLFNGTVSDYARSGAPTVTAVPFTIMVAAELDVLGVVYSPWELCNSTSDNQSFRFQISASNTFDTIATNGTSQLAVSVNTISAVNTPFVGIGRYTSATLRESILNGDIANLGTSTSSRIPSGVNRCSFGMRDDLTPGGPFFDGTIFYAALWNVALDNNECIALSKGITPLMIRPASLLNYWDTFDGSTGTIRDLKNASPLTTTGGATSTARPPVRFERGGSVMRPIPGVFAAPTPSFIYSPTSPAQMNFLMR